ncbi:MAG: fructose-6-phosphate aldolase [Rhodobiaceae bacterium]|nr:fructose-6-phosphate aldolase [Rhodobiaceae bacterium]
MKFFIDTALIDEIKDCWATGLIDGVTTNPTLIKKAGRDPLDVYKSLIDLGIGDISMEVMGTAAEMEYDGMQLYTLFKESTTVKLPMTKEGLQACQRLNNLGIRTNVTLIFNAAQALLAAKAGATYVSPFVGRIDDQGYAGLEVVRSIAGLYKMKGIDTQVLAASIRTPHRVVRSFYNGADVVTMPPKVFWGMYDHILTTDGLRIFDEDATKIVSSS